MKRFRRSGGGWHVQIRDLTAIGMLGAMLVMVLVLKDGCGQGVARFMESFDVPDATRAPEVRYPFDATTEMPEEWKLRTGDWTPDGGAVNDDMSQ